MSDFVIQSADEVVTRTFDFTDVIPDGQTISSAVVTGGTTAAQSIDTGMVSVNVSGVAWGSVVRLVCAATLSNSEVVTKQLVIRGGQR